MKRIAHEPRGWRRGFIRLERVGRKILIATFGSLGDLHPFVALGHALAALGMTPVIATGATYRDYILGEGLGFMPIRPDEGDLTRRLGMDMAEIARRMAANDAFLFDTLILPNLRESYDDFFAASAGADLVVAHSLAFSARLVAEARGLPFVTVLLSPLMLWSPHDPPLAARFPLFKTPTRAPMVSFNRLMLWSAGQFVELWVSPLRRLRRELGLPRRHGLDLLFGATSSAATIGLFSPLLAPPQPDHSARTLIAGHSFHDRYIGAHALAQELDAFLAQGDAPIVFTLGSFVARDRSDYYAACIEAAHALSRRAVLLAHADDAPALRARAPADVFVSSYAPHSLIFPRACAVVHHGGIGTTGQAMRAGRPQVVTPFLGDQHDNAERLRRLGVARIVDGETASADALTRNLGIVLSDEIYARRAEATASAMAGEDGAARAARHIGELICAREARKEAN